MSLSSNRSPAQGKLEGHAELGPRREQRCQFSGDRSLAASKIRTDAADLIDQGRELADIAFERLLARCQGEIHASRIAVQRTRHLREAETELTQRHDLRGSRHVFRAVER